MLYYYPIVTDDAYPFYGIPWWPKSKQQQEDDEAYKQAKRRFDADHQPTPEREMQACFAAEEFELAFKRADVFRELIGAHCLGTGASIKMSTADGSVTDRLAVGVTRTVHGNTSTSSSVVTVCELDSEGSRVTWEETSSSAWHTKFGPDASLPTVSFSLRDRKDGGTSVVFTMNWTAKTDYRPPVSGPALRRKFHEQMEERGYSVVDRSSVAELSVAAAA